MIYLFAILAVAIAAIVGYQIYSVVSSDKGNPDQDGENETSVSSNEGFYIETEPGHIDWHFTATTEAPITYTMAGTTETQAVEVKEEKPKKKKSYYKKKEKKSNGEKTAPKMKAADKKGKKKGGKDNLLLS